MVNREAQDYLQSYHLWDERAERTAERLARLQSLAERTTASYSGMPGSGGSDDKIQRAVEDMEPFIVQLAQEIKEAETRRREIDLILRRLPIRYQRVVFLHHFAGKSFRSIGLRLYLSERQVQRRYEAGLNLIAAEMRKKKLK